MMQIDEPAGHRIALTHLGFRPFFLLAGLAGTLLMAAWLWLYQSGQPLPRTGLLSPITWHAHEMIYGYTVAVIAGFLLTAVRNWTGVQTLHRAPLLLLALLWLLARLMPFVDHSAALPAMAVLDLTFGITLGLALLYPILKVRQWGQLAVLSKVLLLVAANLAFYLGLFGHFDAGIRWGLYGGLYLIVSLLLLMARRVMPFFIEKGVEGTVELRNSRWLDLGSLLLMLAFLAVEVLYPLPEWAGWFAWGLFALHALRLAGWHAPGLWRKPLLWVLYLGYGWVVAGFALRGLQLFLPLNPMAAVHAFAAGGIGLMTAGMMSRVALGHTGRNVFAPPAALRWIFFSLLLGSLLRVLPPLLLPEQHGLWIGASQLLWIAGFGLFTWIYAPMLVRARVDGRYG
jgi:uncharacterized protein involved in response to NO